MNKININKEDLNNLFEFLKRTPLKGAEVPAFNKIINILSNPNPEKKDIKNNG